MNTNTGTNAGETAETATEKDDGFVVIQTQRFMYNVEKCKAKALVGYLMNLVPMPPIENRLWHAFVIRTTQPTLGLDREGNVVDVPAGSDVLIPATHELGQFLLKPAFAPKAVYEVRIAAKTKIKISKIRSMWLYDIGAKPVPVARSQFGLAALVIGEPPKLLTYTVNATDEAVEAEDVGQGGDDAIPF
jgi:hypothetical protein